MLPTLERQTSPVLRPLEFELPRGLEATMPPEARGLARDEVRLLVSNRGDGHLQHTQFVKIASFLDAGDLVVVNDSVTVPAALTATRENGDEIALHLSTRIGADTWVVEPRKTSVRPGEKVKLPGGASGVLVAPHNGSKRLWRARLYFQEHWLTYVETHGKPIAYDYVDGEWPIEMYRTVYGTQPGSSEMPSAGRAFSDRVLASLERRGVGLRRITLHTGVASLEDHEPPYEEWFDVPEATARSVEATRSRGGRVVAVGTTVVRALETASAATGRVLPMSGWTDLIITPERGIQSVDAMLTGFHEPRASHLSMLEAIADREHLAATYAAALDERYLWHEFGDLHLIL